jgi:hypothetical protein
MNNNYNVNHHHCGSSSAVPLAIEGPGPQSLVQDPHLVPQGLPMSEIIPNYFPIPLISVSNNERQIAPLPYPQPQLLTENLYEGSSISCSISNSQRSSMVTLLEFEYQGKAVKNHLVEEEVEGA